MSSNILNVTNPPAGTVLLTVTEGVRVTDGVDGVYELKLNDNDVKLQILVGLGVGVGVTPILSIVKSTSLQSIVGVGTGVGW